MVGAPATDHALEYLLDFDGRQHWFEQGYYLKFRIKRVLPHPQRPQGLRYSFSLHDESGKRLVGFDNAHPVKVRSGALTIRPIEADHWHRTSTDKGRPYKYEGAEKLLDDFFKEVRRVLAEHGIQDTVIDVTEERSKR